MPVIEELNNFTEIKDLLRIQLNNPKLEIDEYLGRVIERFRELVLFRVRLCLPFEGKVFDLSWSIELSAVELSKETSLMVTRFLSLSTSLLTVTRFLSTFSTFDVDDDELRSESDNDLKGWCDVCWTFVVIFEFFVSSFSK